MASIQSAMNGAYANAKICFRGVAWVQVAMLATAMAAMLTGSDNAARAAIATFVGPLAVFVLRELGSHFYGKGERARKIFILQSGLGRR